MERFIGGFAVGAISIVLAAVVVVVATDTRAGAPRESHAKIATYSVSADGMDLTVTTWLGRLQDVVRSSVVERDRTVVVGVVITSRSGTSTAELTRHDVVLRLNRPLGDRVVLDEDREEVALEKR